MKLSKKILAALLITASLVITGCGQVKLGYVDGKRVMTESTQIKAVIEEGQKKVEEIEKEAQAEFEKNPNWTDEEKLKAQGDLQRKLMGINQSYATQLQHKIQEAMNDIAKKNDLDAIVDSSKENPIVLKGGIDLTDEVIKKLQ